MAFVLTEKERALVKSSAFFGSLPTDVFEAVVSRCRVIKLREGDPLFRQGEPAQSIFAVLDGMVKLSRTSQAGDEVVVEVFQPGASFAEALAFKSALYPVSATALLDCRILEAPNEVVKTEIMAQPEGFGAILGATFAHLHSLLNQIEELKSSSGHRRLARYILAKATFDGVAVVAELPFEKQVLASLLGIKPETLSRAFRKLEAHGLSVDGRKVRVADPDALRLFIEDAA